MKFIILFLFIVSCATEGKKDLEVSMKLTQDPTMNSKALATQDKNIINPTTVLTWQQFFKNSPDEKSRKKIQQKLDLMESSKSKKIEDILARARNYKSIGELEKAEPLYREVLRHDPQHFNATIEVSQLYLMKRDIETAFDYIANSKKILEDQEHPEKLNILQHKYTLALAYIYSNREDSGHTLLSEILSADSRFMLAYLALAGSYLKKGKLDMALFVSKRGLDHDPDNPELTNVLGIISSKKGDLREAQSYFNKAIQKKSSLVSALVNRANLSINRGEYSPAEIDLKKAIKNNPYHTNAYISLGILQKKTGRFTAAKASFQKALDLSPESAFARYNLAVLMSDNFQDKNDALRLFYEVIQSSDQTQEIKELAKIHIQGLRDSRISPDVNTM